MAATREQVLEAYAANPLAEPNPSESAIQYWQNVGLGSFDQTVAAVRAADPRLARQIDEERPVQYTTGQGRIDNSGALPSPVTPTLFSAPVEPAQTSAPAKPLPKNFNSQGTYLAFVDNLKNKEVDPLAAINSLNVGPEFKQAITTIYNQIVQQQKAGTSEYWGTGTLASKEGAAAEMALRLAEGGAQSLTDIGTRQVEFKGSTEGEDYTTTSNELYSKSTGQPLNYNTNSGGLKLNYDIQTLPDGTVVPVATKRQSDWMKFRENVLKPGVAIALSTLGAPVIGAALAPGAGLAAQGALGGAIAGTGSAALTGGDLLQGALLGGAGGYLRGAASVPAQDSIYSLANGTPNLDYMGGGQGLTSTGAANLPSMNGAQGLQILAGVPSETLAGALSTFGGVNPAIIEGMGLGSGISYVTPSGIVTGNGTIIGGDVISELGRNTGFNLPGWLNENVGAGIGDTLAQVNTGVNSGLFSGVTPPDSTSTTTQKDVTTSGSSTGLSPSQVASLIKAGVGLVGATGAVSAATNAGGGTGTPMQAPTQGVPTNDPNYYNQLQQYYNAYLPQTPRDVVTPLQQWYNSSYGA